MEWFDALTLSRLQFAFTVSFHIIFPSFSIGLASYLAVLNFLHLKTDNPVYRLFLARDESLLAQAGSLPVSTDTTSSEPAGGEDGA